MEEFSGYISITVPSASRSNDAHGKEHVWYTIQVSGPHVNKILQRKFSDFRAFDATWRKLYPSVPHVLPPKVYFNNRSPKVVSYRRQILQIYLNGLLAVQSVVPFLAHFLNVQEGQLRIAKKRMPSIEHRHTKEMVNSGASTNLSQPNSSSTMGSAGDRPHEMASSMMKEMERQDMNRMHQMELPQSESSMNKSTMMMPKLPSPSMEGGVHMPPDITPRVLDRETLRNLQDWIHQQQPMQRSAQLDSQVGMMKDKSQSKPNSDMMMMNEASQMKKSEMKMMKDTSQSKSNSDMMMKDGTRRSSGSDSTKSTPTTNDSTEAMLFSKKPFKQLPEPGFDKGHNGLRPVRVIPPPSPRSNSLKPKLASLLRTVLPFHSANDIGLLNFETDQIIQLLDTNDPSGNGLWFGRHLLSGQEGYFPKAFVTFLPTNDSNEPTPRHSSLE